MNQVHDLGHCRIHSSFGLVRRRKLDRDTIAEKTAREEEVIDISRCCFSTLRVHTAMRQLYQCLCPRFSECKYKQTATSESGKPSAATALCY